MKRFSNNVRRRGKMPRYKGDEHEFEKGAHGVLRCKECGAVYFEKSWHHASVPKIVKLGSALVNARSVMCPACQMIRDDLFEGRIRVFDVPKKFHDELIGLAKGFCHRAWEKDPLDRLIRIDDHGSEIEILVTENQLGQKLGKKIADTFRKVEMKISYPKVPGDSVELRLQFRVDADETR